MLRLASGVDMMTLAMKAALGVAPAIAEVPATSAVGYRFFFQPPVSARRTIAVDGLDRLKLVPGVESITMRRPLGSGFDARDGTRSHVFAVVGWAEDYAGRSAGRGVPAQRDQGNLRARLTVAAWTSVLAAGVRRARAAHGTRAA